MNSRVVTAGTVSLGRVVGLVGGSLSNNYALNNMDVEYSWNGTTGTAKTISPGLNVADGMDVALSDTQVQAWWDGTTSGVWATPWDFTNVWKWDSTLQRPVLQW